MVWSATSEGTLTCTLGGVAESRKLLRMARILRPSTPMVVWLWYMAWEGWGGGSTVCVRTYVCIWVVNFGTTALAIVETIGTQLAVLYREVSLIRDIDLSRFVHRSMWLGLQTVSSLERCPLFRAPFIERFYCSCPYVTTLSRHSTQVSVHCSLHTVCYSNGSSGCTSAVDLESIPALPRPCPTHPAHLEALNFYPEENVVGEGLPLELHNGEVC